MLFFNQNLVQRGRDTYASFYAYYIHARTYVQYVSWLRYPSVKIIGTLSERLRPIVKCMGGRGRGRNERNFSVILRLYLLFLHFRGSDW